MMSVFLQGAQKEANDLDRFAQLFFSAIGVMKYEMRESVNYIDGYYFKGIKEGLVYTVYVGEEHENLPFCVGISADYNKDDLKIIVDCSVREYLIPAGFCFAYIVNYGRHDERLIKY